MRSSRVPQGLKLKNDTSQEKSQHEKLEEIIESRKYKTYLKFYFAGFSILLVSAFFLIVTVKLALAIF